MTSSPGQASGSTTAVPASSKAFQIPGSSIRPRPNRLELLGRKARRASLELP